MTCPHCQLVGKDTSKYRGRFRRRHLAQKKCLAYKEREAKGTQ